MQPRLTEKAALTSTQQAMLHASMRAPRDPAYLIQLILPLKATFPGAGIEATDSAVSDSFESNWSKAWCRVVEAHPILRLVYLKGETRIVSREMAPEWVSVDLRHLSPTTYRKHAEQLCASERKAGFDFSSITGTMLCRCLWLKPPPGVDPIWCLTIHHALVDGNSLAPLVRNVLTELNDTHPFPVNVAFQERARSIAATDWSMARAYFKERAGAQAMGTDPAISIPRSNASSPREGPAHRVLLPIDLKLNEQINALDGVRSSTLVHAAWSILLSRLTGQNSVIFGVTRHCRGNVNEGLKNALGPYSNVLPLQINVVEDSPVSAWLEHVRNAWLDLEAIELCPLHELQFPDEPNHTKERLFETLVNFARIEPVVEVASILGDLAAETPIMHQKTDLPLSLTMQSEPVLDGFLVARPDAYSHENVGRLATVFVHVLRQLVSQQELPVSEISLWPESESYLGVGSVVSRLKTSVVSLLRDVVLEHAGSIAVSTPTRTWTYGEIWQRAGDFAHKLESKAVDREDVIAILTGRSVETVIAMIGSHRADTAFFVVGEDLPLERKVDCIRAAGSRLVVSAGDTNSDLTNHLPDVEWIFPADGELAIPLAEHLPNERGLAYLVATSGTTGAPRLVMIEHRSLANMVQGYAEILRPGPGDVRYQSASAESDTFVLEVMLYLCTGATLHLDARLLEFGLSGFDLMLRRRGITIVGLPSSLWREWVEARQSRKTGPNTSVPLRAVICTMERTDPDMLRTWRLHDGRNLVWINAYGPSEAACVSTLFHLEPGEPAPEGEIPVGRPLPNTQVYVVDSKQRHLPMGFIGEIVIGGQGVGRGYLNSPEATAKKFVPNPFCKKADARLYLTGDLGYFRDNGQLVFIGRRDYQVKIRGHRIELEEVELALGRHPAIHDAAAVAVSHGHLKQLVAFYASNDECSASELRTHLLRLLPPAAIPHRFVRRENVPRSALGKLQRDILELEASEHLEAENKAAAATLEWNPGDSLEDKLCFLFGRVLLTHALDPGDDFFLLGGDSLSAVVLLSEIEQYIGLSVSLTALFIHTSPARLANHLEAEFPASQPHCMIPLSPDGHTTPLLFIHDWTGDLFEYIPLARTLGVNRPVWGLQAIEHTGKPRDPSVEVMGKRYAAEILRELGDTPAILCGYSLGGLIAFETARHLLAAGCEVNRLFIIDSLPANLPMITNLKMYTAYLREINLGTLRRENYNLTGFLRHHINGLRRVVARGGRPDKTNLGKVEAHASDYYSQLVYRYYPQPLPIEITLFRSIRGLRDVSPGWRYLGKRGLNVITVPWEHLEILGQAALDDLASLIQEELDR